MNNTNADSHPSPHSTDADAGARRQIATRIIVLYAGFFLLMFAGLIAFGVYRYVIDRKVSDFTYYEAGGVAIALLISLISVVMGTRVMIRDASTPKIVIPAEDRALLEDMIRDGNEKAIDQYVRLSSLSGTTGTATKLGLTGLPLATVGLTIFFSVIAIFGVDGFLDLAKLTLGAFIGSFVQRTVSGERATVEGIKIFNSTA